MRTNRVTPKGIIRITGEHDAGDGACDEVINLRYEQGSMRLCGKKGLLATSSTIFLAFYRHRLPGVDRYIGIYVKNGRLKVSTVTIDNGIASPDAERVSNPAPAIAVFDEGDTIDVKFINNLLIISSENEQKIYTFYYADNTYSLLSDGSLPDIQLGFVKNDYYPTHPSYSISGTLYDGINADYVGSGVAAKYSEKGNIAISDIAADVNAGLSYIRHTKDKHKTEGWVAVCANFTLFDGSETKPSQPVWYYLGGAPELRFGMPEGSIGNGDLYIGMTTSSLKVNIAAIVGNDYAKYKDLIKSINIYSTYPHSGWDMSRSLELNSLAILNGVRSWADDWKTMNGHNTHYVTYVYNGTIYSGKNKSNISSPAAVYPFERTDVAELDAELFRLQKSFPYQEHISSEFVELDFSEAAVAGRLMPTENSGYVRRYGKMTTYNSRLHLFDIKNNFKMPGDGGNPDGLFGPSWMFRADSISDTTAFAAQIATWTGKTVQTALARCAAKTKKEGKTLLASRILQIPTFSDTVGGVTTHYAVVRALPTVTDRDSFSADLYLSTYVFNAGLRPSQSYNFSYAEAIKADGAKSLGEFYTGTYQLPTTFPSISSGQILDDHYTAAFEFVCVPLEYTTVDWIYDFTEDDIEYGEDDTVVVSAQNNPTYFSPENSYRIGGKVLAVSPNAGAVSDVQVGQYPLAVFTDNGIYTLIQGDGKVLYSNVAKIAEDVMKEGSSVLPTTYGITFLSGDGVFLLVGRKCAKISLALDGPPDWDIRQCEQYQRAHECTEAHLCAWCDQVTGNYVYTETDEPSAGDIVYDKYGDSLSLTVSSASGQTITVSGTTYTYTAAENRNLLYNIQPYLSDDFRDEIADVSKVKLLFDAYKAELILSITDKPYSYVYSFTERLWHKITETFAFGSEALALVYPPVATGETPTCEIRNVNDETFGINEPVMVHLQTRCVKFGTESYKAVHRLLGRVNVNNTHDYDIPNGDITGMYLYASRDLRHWSMVGLYQHKGYTDLMHINKTAAHFKYFLITFGGKLIEDSEITGFDADVLYRYQDKER